ncbi:MAG: PQQ-binding-like beta-propeller repeat protein [Phycisphaeraceae bacterium]|nr:PQQ-binding-like beta-propeller repeat protein [Phycisphaeraceae bacterium]
MKINQCPGLILVCGLITLCGCSNSQTTTAQAQQTAMEQNQTPSKPGLIGGTLRGTGKVIGSTFNATDRLLRGTVSLIPFVDIRKAKDSQDPQQTPSFRDDFPIAATDLVRMGLKVHWASNLDVPKTETISQWALLEGGYLITIETPSNLFTLINLRDGSIVWRQIHGQNTDKFFQPFRYGDRICVNSETDLLKIDLRTGLALEISQLKSVVRNTPAHVKNFAIFGGLNGRIFAHDLNTGFSKWNYQMQAGITAKPTASATDVLISDSSGVYILLDAMTGEPRWKGRAFRQISASSSISLKESMVLIPSEDQTLYALDMEIGNDIWQFHAKRALTSKPIILGNMILMPVTGDGLYALNLKTGKPIWNTSQVLSAFDSDDDFLYCYQKNSLWVLDKSSGKTISQTPTDNIKDIMALSNGQFLVMTQTGRLLKLQR